MTNKAVILELHPGTGYGQIQIESIWTGPIDSSPGAGETPSICSLATSEPSMMVLNSDTQTVTGYFFDIANQKLSMSGSTHLENQTETIAAISVGGSPYLFGYSAKTGSFCFYSIATDLTLQLVYKFNISYGAVTSGFTTIHPYSYKELMLILAYNKTNGDAGIYRIQVPADEPLSVERVWTDEWAKGWKKFGFFKLGGENFFIKSNADHKNTVFIDHLVDDPKQGSHPVGRHLGEMNPVALTTITVDELACFATLDNSGQLTLNRFRDDCQGWVPAGSLPIGNDGKQLVSLSSKSGSYMLVA